MISKEDFIENFKKRTRAFAVAVIKYCNTLPYSQGTKVICYQLIKSSTSTASNYRASCRARSQAEFHSKMSIVVEEADESLFWLEVIEEANLDNTATLKYLQQECTEILKVVSKARSNSK
jgi:four helix bundle protein